MTSEIGSKSPQGNIKRILVALIGAQTVFLALQGSHISGDDPVRQGAVLDLAAGKLPNSHFSVIFPMLATPVFILARAVGFEKEFFERFGLLCYATWAFLVGRQLSRLRNATLAITFTILSFCSLLTPYVMGFNAEAFSAMLLSGGLLAAISARHKSARYLGWCLAILAVANIPAQLPGFVVMCAAIAIRKRRFRSMWPAIVLLAAVIVEASLANGHLSFSKYTQSSSATSPLLPWGKVVDFGHPLIFGVVAILFSLGRGLVFYSPTLAFAFVRATDSAGEWALSLAIFTVALIPIYAKWWAWYGGITFGPRFFLVGCIPGAFAVSEVLRSPQGQSRARLMAAALTVGLSAWVAITGALWFLTSRAISFCMVENYRYEPLCWYSAEYSSLMAPLWDHGVVRPGQVVFACFVVIQILAVMPLIVREVAGPSADALLAITQKLRRPATGKAVSARTDSAVGTVGESNDTGSN